MKISCGTFVQGDPDREIAGVVIEFVVVDHELDKARVLDLYGPIRTNRIDPFADAHDKRSDSGLGKREMVIVPAVAVWRTGAVRGDVDLFYTVGSPTDHPVGRDLDRLAAFNF